MSSPERRGDRRRSRRGPVALIGLVLVAVLSLSGCADRTDRTDRDVDPTGTSTGVDEQTLASIEQSVSEAEAILSGLDQEFHQDDDE